jgi:hypothetical protein
VGEILELVGAFFDLVVLVGRHRAKSQARRRLESWSRENSYRLLREPVPEARALLRDCVSSSDRTMGLVLMRGSAMMVESFWREADPCVAVYWPCAGRPLDPGLVDKGWTSDARALLAGLPYASRARVRPKALQLFVHGDLTPELADDLKRRMERGEREIFSADPFR